MCCSFVTSRVLSSLYKIQCELQFCYINKITTGSSTLCHVPCNSTNVEYYFLVSSFVSEKDMVPCCGSYSSGVPAPPYQLLILTCLYAHRCRAAENLRHRECVGECGGGESHGKEQVRLARQD